MTLLGKGRQFIWGKEQQQALMRSNADFKDHQFYIYLTDMDVFNCTQILANLPLVVHCIKSRTDNQDL